MNLHIFDDICDESTELLNFKNLLKYSLHLYNSCDDLIISEENYTDSAYIEAIFKKCYDICKPLFHRSSPYYFFGSPPSYLGEDKETIYANLYRDNSFWESAIKYQCIISSLITLIHFNSKELKISFYTLCNKFKGEGYFSLLNKNILFFDNRELKYKTYEKTNKSIEYSEKFSNFVKTFKTFCKYLTPSELNILGIESNSDIPFFNADLLFRLYDICKNTPVCKKFNRFYQNNDKLFSLDEYFQVSNALKDELLKKYHSFNKVDKLLFQYKLERYYNFSLNNCIIESTTNFFKESDFLKFIPLEFLLFTFNLPNVFSRNGFFKFALYSFNNKEFKSSTFYKRNDDSGPVNFVEIPESNTSNLINWLDLYKKFITFFSYIIFPIFEHCFFIILKDNLTYKQSKDFDFINKSIDLLSQYITEHYDDILKYNRDEYNLFGNEEFLIPKISFTEKNEKNNLNLVFKNILVKENSIIHPNPPIPLTPEYFNFIPQEKFHRKLMNLIVESTLSKY